jgi:two-component system, cell cycle response regulator DivK
MNKRILVVEDQEDNRQIVRDLLTVNDYEIIEAENGEEALAAVVKSRPDLILMDIQLPVMDGYEATRRIKADPSLSSIPIIAVTSYALNGDEEKARAAGCNDFVPKPYSPRPASRKDPRVFAIAEKRQRSWSCNWKRASWGQQCRRQDGDRSSPAHHCGRSDRVAFQRTPPALATGPV